MSKNICMDCEKLFIDAAMKSNNFDSFLDWTIETLDTKICIKCLVRIWMRYKLDINNQ